MKLILPVSVFDDYVEHCPDFCENTITDVQLDRIRKLAQAAKELDVYKIVEFDHVESFYQYDYDAEDEHAAVECEDFRTECSMLNVTTDHFYWSGFIKHTDICWETEAVFLSELTDSAVVDRR